MPLDNEQIKNGIIENIMPLDKNTPSQTHSTLQTQKPYICLSTNIYLLINSHIQNTQSKIFPAYWFVQNSLVLQISVCKTNEF